MPDALLSQFLAALAQLRAAVERCPDDLWNTPLAGLTFDQAAFHALFFADYYLAPTAPLATAADAAAFRAQPFHAQHAADFADYEELEDRPQRNTYSRAFLLAYADHCAAKARAVIAAETDASLAAPCPFPNLERASRAELHIYNTRHLQHHAAQLTLHLRQLAPPNTAPDWTKRGP